MNHGLRSMKQFFKIFDVKIVEFSEKNALNCESKTDFNIRAITCYKRSRTRAWDTLKYTRIFTTQVRHLHGGISAYFWQQCGRDYVNPCVLKRAHDESKQQAEAVIISVEQEKEKEFADKCRSELNEFLDDAFKKIKTKNENIKVLNMGDAFEILCDNNVANCTFPSTETSTKWYGTTQEQLILFL